MIFLETERLILRQVEPRDADIMFDYRNNETCARFQRGQTRELDQIQKLIERRKKDALGAEENCLIAVALKETDEMIGEIVVMPNDDCFSLGYTFSYNHHRKGYAFEALSALIETLHERYPNWEFISFTEPDNIPSMALLKKLGYDDLGYVPQLDSKAFGKWVKENPLH